MGDITQNLTLTLYVFLPTRVLGGGNVWSRVGPPKGGATPKSPKLIFTILRQNNIWGSAHQGKGIKQKATTGLHHAMLCEWRHGGP